MRRILLLLLFMGHVLPVLSQPRELPPVSTKTIEFKERSHSVELTYAEVAWGPKTWESILQGVEVSGSRRWFFALMKLHGKATIDDLRLKSGRYALILNPRRDGPPTISFLATREKRLVSPNNLRGELPQGREMGEVTTQFKVMESIVDPLHIEFRSEDSTVVLHFRYGNQEMEKTLKFK